MNEIDKTAMNKLNAQIEKNVRYIQSRQGRSRGDLDNTKALSMSVLMDYYNISQSDAYDALTEGQLDCGIDAFYYDLELDDEGNSNLIIIQSKFKKEDGKFGAIQEKDIKSCIGVCQKILQGKELDLAHKNLREKIKAYRDELKDNNYPHTKVSLILATNGKIHEDFKTMDEIISFKESGHDVAFIDASSYGKVKEAKQARLFVSLLNYGDCRNKIFKYDKYDGGIFSCSLFDLMQYYKEAGEEALLNQNVRFKIKKSRINQEIEKSFLEDPRFFCFLNNGITLVCSDFKIGETCHDKSSITINNPSIVNGGQTISTLYALFNKRDTLFDNQEVFKQAFVVVRLYKVPQECVLKIAVATNSQNPIDVVDLKSNDLPQKMVKEYFSKKGIGLLIKEGEDVIYYDDTITNQHLLQVYVSLHEGLPHLAKQSKKKVFDEYYDKVFDANFEKRYEALFRCYEIANFVNRKKIVDKVLVSHAFFAIIYTMSRLDERIMNGSIPLKNIKSEQLFQKALSIIKQIIGIKKELLKERFSLNNLFKSGEIKDLIDLHLEEVSKNGDSK